MKKFLLLALLALPIFAQDPSVTAFRWKLVLPGIADTGDDKYIVFVKSFKVDLTEITVTVAAEGEKLQTQTIPTNGDGVVFVFTIPPKPNVRITRRVFETTATGTVLEVQ